MLGERPDGTLVKLEKGCGCICHNEPHWAYVDRLWREKNRELLREEGRTLEQRYYGALGFPKEELARLAAKAGAFRAAGIVRMIHEPSDELTDIQRAKLAPPKPPEISPYVDEVTEVRMKARKAW